MKHRHVFARFSLHILVALAAAACSSGGSGGGGGGGPVTPPIGAAPPPYLAGLTAVAAGAATVRIDWTPPVAGFDTALFQSSTANAVYTGPPVAEGLGAAGLVLTGLADGVPQFFGLGVRTAGGGAYQPTGIVLSAVPGAPIYVDATAAPGGDGTTPGTAFDDLLSAFLTAFGMGGANIWVRDGQYDATALPMLAGVALYGGFDGTFDLANRDAASAATILNGIAADEVIEIQGNAPPAILDGIVIDGGGLATIAIDSTDTDVEIRSVTVHSCTGRGISLRNSSTTDEVDVQITSSSSSQNGADGLSARGAFDLRIDGSAFDANFQEGLELDDLVALEGDTATLEILGCRFFGNGSEGLDVDLSAPLAPGPMGGFFSILVRGSRFERNGLDGLLVDQDYELTPGYDGEITILECLARANSGHGVSVDADAPAPILMHRILSTGNGGDGIFVSSESDAGFAVLSASVVTGNLGAGVRATLGNKPVMATHCILAGNFGGGLLSEFTRSTASSTIGYLQANPWQATELVGEVVVSDPMAGAFEVAPEAYAHILSQLGDSLMLADASGVALGAPVELADDGDERAAMQIMGNTVILDTAPADFAAPGLLCAFAPGAGVVEDYTLPVGSPAAGAGLTPPGGPIVDAGIAASPAAGAPGVADDVRQPFFTIRSTTPAPSQALGAMDDIEVTFSDMLDPTSVVAGEVRAVTSLGAELSIVFAPMGEHILVMPPPGGWGSDPFRLELHGGLRAQDGTDLSTPLVLPFAP